MTVALDPGELAGNAVEPNLEALLELACTALIEEGGERRGKDCGLACAGSGGERLEAAGQIPRQEELVANLVSARHALSLQKLGTRVPSPPAPS